MLTDKDPVVCTSQYLSYCQFRSCDCQVLCNLRRHFAEGEAVKCTVVSGKKKTNKHVVSLIGK